MENLKDNLKERHASRFANFRPEDFKNRGLGFMHVDERSDLLAIGAIVANGDQDAIACDGWCVNVENRGDWECVYEGGKFGCEQEKNKIMNMRPTAKVKIASYPKAYPDYYENKNNRMAARVREDESIDELTKIFN